jgi:hypothetical protein
MIVTPTDQINEMHGSIVHFLEKWAEIEGFDDPVIVALIAASDALFTARMVRTDAPFEELTVNWEDKLPIPGGKV